MLKTSLLLLFLDQGLVYSSLKVSSMIATGAFGALALLTKYKDQSGKITKWGRIALGGICLSLATSLGLYAVETSKAKDSAERAKNDFIATTNRLETLISKAERTAQLQQDNLQVAEKIKGDLGTSLDKQESVLTGNERIFEGVNETLDEQKVQEFKLKNWYV